MRRGESSSRILFQQHRDEVHALWSGPDCVAEAAGHSQPSAEVTPLLGTWPRADVEQLAFLEAALEPSSQDTGAAPGLLGDQLGRPGVRA